MASIPCTLPLLLLLLFLGRYPAVQASEPERATYIVHVAKSEMPQSFDHHAMWYESSLKSVSNSAQMIYTYDNAIHGYATRLTPEEARLLESQTGILAVLPEMRYELHTTRTPQFLGLDKSADMFPESNSASDVVVGVLDTGVWPESKSFDDTGLGPVPRNGLNFSGVSLYRGNALPDSPLPFVYAGNASNATNGNLCVTGTLSPEKVAGKIVLCDRGLTARVQKGSVVKSAGALGMVLSNTAANGEELVADAHLLPASAVGEKAGDAIKKYLFTEAKPTVSILFEGTKVGIQPSPVVAAFSSRGPNSITPQILKPDLIAPGVNILAGWSKAVGPTGLPVDNRRVDFNIISGTSMSCPHVSGLAALIKSVHPEWSPAAVRSALMTTAYTVYKTGAKLQDSATGKPSTPFDHGAGHVDPVTALNPGLVYDLTVDDYLGFLCALNYSASEINTLAKRKFECNAGKQYSVNDLNYPSFAVLFESGSGSGVVKHSRTLTNVGPAGTYKASVTSDTASVKISVDPQVVTLKENEKKSFVVTFSSSASAQDKVNAFGRLEWSDGKHVVATPISINWA
ncbi:hypothetical protein ACSQ67_007523 [Phaseolus vulgaris]